MTHTIIYPIRPLHELTLLQHSMPAAQMPIPWQTRHIQHRIPAGFPSPAADYEEKNLDLNDYLIKNKSATFIFTVVGDSMKNVGIMDGDKVIVDKSVEPKHRHIVIAVVNREYTIKRFLKVGNAVELRAENPDYKPIRFAESDELEIWGVVVGCLRKVGI